jgi:ribose 5-phosphate isomerase B
MKHGVFFDRIFFASDHKGFSLKEDLFTWFLKNPISNNFCSIQNCGAFSDERVDFPEFAIFSLKSFSKLSCAVLICDSGNGMNICANRFPHIKAAKCYSKKEVETARNHNDINVLTLGSAYVSFEEAKEIILAFLKSSFLKGQYAKRLEMIDSITF